MAMTGLTRERSFHDLTPPVGKPKTRTHVSRRGSIHATDYENEILLHSSVSQGQHVVTVYDEKPIIFKTAVSNFYPMYGYNPKCITEEERSVMEQKFMSHDAHDHHKALHIDGDTISDHYHMKCDNQKQAVQLFSQTVPDFKELFKNAGIPIKE
jgi:hypothetical protein